MATFKRNKKPTDAELKQLYEAARKAHAAGNTTAFLKMSAVLEMFEPRPKKYSKKLLAEFGRRARNRNAAIAKKPRKKYGHNHVFVMHGATFTWHPGSKRLSVELKNGETVSAGMFKTLTEAKKHARTAWTSKRNRNGLRAVGRSISRGAKRAVAGVDRFMQKHLGPSDDELVKEVRDHALYAGAQYNDYNMGAARHELGMAHATLAKIEDSSKRERAAKTLIKLERMLGMSRNRRASSTTRRRTHAGVHNRNFWGN